MIPYATSIRYMIAGYAVIFIIIIAYLVSLVLRWRKVKQEIASMENLSEK
jgi:CcmD family protein